MMKLNKKEILALVIILILQTVLYLTWSFQKAYIHMDEAYSLGLSSYDKVEIQHNEDFYDTWHTKDYYEDYLSLQDDEKTDFRPVYENQKNDVHPPFYYLFLRLGMFFDGGHYSKWPGVIINMIIYLFITVLMYLISKRLLQKEKHSKEKALVVTFLAAITMASISSVLYIRMYALATLNIVLTTYLHLLLSEDENRLRTMILIGITALIGSLTHYYYLFFLAAMFLLFALRFFQDKKYNLLIKYSMVMVIAGIASLSIFPHSIQHMFFGYRGQGFISKLKNTEVFLKNLLAYLAKLDLFTFHCLLTAVLIVILVIYSIQRFKKKFSKYHNPNPINARTIWVPTLFYGLIVSVASPWIELRYIMPVCGLVFITVAYYLYLWLRTVLSEKKCNAFFAVFFTLLIIAPFGLKITPESAFVSRKEMVDLATESHSSPALYMFNSGENRFLDDILLFSIIDESYVAKDMDCTEENIKTIFKDKDLSNGFFVFINSGQENDDLLAVIKKATNKQESPYIYRLNACDVYFVK
ncbi:MAG: glycosyltransferase family 39 protein [Ruminococcaceae bacterium]|nr:glycosyltransferase family 39 protein [Oscillospiraceae bacterium]